MFSELARKLRLKEHSMISPRETAQILLHNDAHNYDYVSYTCNFVESTVCIACIAIVYRSQTLARYGVVSYGKS